MPLKPLIRGGAKFNSFTTTNWIWHLKNHHLTKHQYTKKEKQMSATMALQQPLHQSFHKVKKDSGDHPKVIGINIKIIN